MLFADLLWRTGWSTSRTVLLGLFIILFLLTAIGCMHGVYGFFIRIFGTRRRITGLKPYRDQNIEGVSTAIIFPIYNEDSVRVLEGLRATYESLERTGQLDHFDFFILSDSTNPDRWMEEERRWSELVCDLDALGKIYYRRRLFNEERKSGNVRDFLNTWGKRYRYFVCCDADSVMRGETLVDLVKLMEAHPTVGLIQTVPALVNAESLVRPHPAVCQPPICAGVHRGTELLGAGFWQLLGPQRHHPHRTVHAVLRSAATAGPQTLRRANFEPRFCGGGADAPRKLAGLAGLRSGGQLRGGAAVAH